jgi:hypothetical protein
MIIVKNSVPLPLGNDPLHQARRLADPASGCPDISGLPCMATPLRQRLVK